MKKLLALVVFAATGPLQATPYSEADLRKLEYTSAVASTAATVISAVTQADGSVKFIRDLSGTTNELMAYALLEQSSIMRFTRALKAVAANDSWSEAPLRDAAFMKIFVKEFAVTFSQSITQEVVSVLQNKALSKVLGKMPNRIVLRIADLVSTSVTATLVEVIFNYLNEVNDRRSRVFARHGEDEDLRSTSARPITTDYVLNIFSKTLLKELAFHIAGEVIRQGAEDNSYVSRFLAENS